jgi:hypothetical protein
MACSAVRIGALAAFLIAPLSGFAQTQELTLAVPASASPVRVNPDGTVSIAAEGIAVGLLLERLQSMCAMDVRLDAAAGARPVSIEVSGLEPIAAVGAVLKASGLDFAMRVRCGTVEHPTLILVRESGGGPPDTTSLALHADDAPPHSGELPSLEPGPAPEDESDPRDKPATTILGGSEPTRELAPGELTSTQLVELLTPPPGPRPAVIELPFTDENGHPYLQASPSGPRRTITLPFPDANGDPIEVAVPPGPRVPNVAFPVVRPDGSGKPTGAPPAPVNPADARRPRGGGPER